MLIKLILSRTLLCKLMSISFFPIFENMKNKDKGKNKNTLTRNEIIRLIIFVFLLCCLFELKPYINELQPYLKQLLGVE